MEAVRGWHREQAIFLSIYCYPEIDAFSVVLFDARFTVDCEQQNLCHALLAACIEANRKMKEMACIK
jgi:hypothetical protein